MSIKRLVPLNTVSLPSNPPTAIAGDIYYNSGISKLLYFNGTDWIELASSASSLIYSILSPSNGNILVYDSATSTWKNTNTLQSTASTIPLIIKGSASQTANLQEWQNSSGTVTARFTKDGEFSVTDAYVSYFSGASNYSATLNVQTADPTYAGLVIRGKSAQTGDLQKWQNSAGTTLLGITAGGALFNPSNTSATSFGMQSNAGTPQGAYFQVFGNNHTTLTQRGGAEFVFSSENSGTGGFTVFQYQSGAWNPKFKIFNSGYTSINSTSSTLGSSSATHQLGVVSASAATVGAVIRGATSQTANLQEWQDSAGAVLAKINSTGGGILPFMNVTGAGGTTNMLQVTSTTSGSLALFRFTTADGANFDFGKNDGPNQGGSAYFYTTASVPIEFSNAANRRMVIETNGNINIGGLAGTSLAKLTVFSQATGVIGQVIRGASGQTANLQEWQNSSGTVVASMNNSGDLTNSAVYTRYLRGGNEPIVDLAALRFKANSPIIPSSVFKGIANQSSHLHQYQNSSGTVLSGFNAAGHIFVGTTEPANGVDVYYTWTAAATTSATVATFTSNSTVILASSGQNITVSGFSPAQFNGTFTVTSVTGSSGAYVYTVYNPAANFTFPDSATSTAGTIRTGAGATFVAPTLYSVPVLVKGAGTQSTNLTEWQNSSGAILARVSSGGAFVTSAVGVFGAQSNTPNAQLYVLSNSITNPTFVAKAIASQTSNLTEWQDSSGTVITRIDSSGQNIWTYSIRPQATPSSGSFIQLDSNQVRVTQQTAGAIAFIVKGATSQTANLQEWQNSTGTVLNAINSSGYLIGGQFDSNGNLTNVLYINAIRNLGAGNPYGSSDTDEPKLSLFGKTGQTSNFIEIKSIGGGSGNLLLSITSDGSIKGGNSFTISANTATTVDTVAISSFTTIEYTISIKQGSKVRSSKVLVHTDGTSIDSTEYGIMEMGGGITGILVTASVSSTNSILQVTITDAATTNATVKLIKTML